MKKLPIAVSSFAKMREDDYYYVDKTAQLQQLLDEGQYFFLSRPRRFGKSLLLDTCSELFKGSRALFKGLAIEPHWDWSVSYPVIRISFGSGVLKNLAELDVRVRSLLRENYRHLGLDLPEQEDAAGVFRFLIERAHTHYQQKVVVLIDEYDKPILDNIEDVATAQQMREGLKDLYSVLKDMDAHLRFVLLTGVSKFSKVSLFSGLNQLEDISLDARFATICGYTQHDLETTFAEPLAGVDWQKLKRWYNGYNFLGDSVYNPYDILLFISKGHSYRNYWFETGSPSFLIKLFQQNRYFLPKLENIEVGEDILNSFDIEVIEPTTLLYQTGYLTIQQQLTRRGHLRFVLQTPNEEVRVSLADQLINAYVPLPAVDKYPIQNRLFDVLMAGDLAGLQQQITTLFAGIPWRNFTQNDLSDSEGYYASVVYAFFASLNATIIPEDISNHGQADLTIILGDYVYVMEFKRDHQAEYQQQTPNPALEQVKARHYAKKYQGQGKTVFEVGLIFNSAARNLVQMDWA